MNDLSRLLQEVGGFNASEAASMLQGVTNVTVEACHNEFTSGTSAQKLVGAGFIVGAFVNRRNFELVLPFLTSQKYGGRSLRICSEGGLLCIFNAECESSPEEGPTSGNLMTFEGVEVLVLHLDFWSWHYFGRAAARSEKKIWISGKAFFWSNNHSMWKKLESHEKYLFEEMFQN